MLGAPATKRLKVPSTTLDREAEKLSNELNQRAQLLPNEERVRRHDVLKRISVSIPDEGDEK